MSSNETAAVNAAGIHGTTRRPQEAVEGSELPFLVTHWLRNFNASVATASTTGQPQNAETATGNSVSDENQRRAALEQIRRATSELASAFSTLGAYGASTVPSLSTSATTETINRQAQDAQSTRNATFSDLNRRWAGLPSNHLENLVEAAVSSTVAVEEVTSATAESNLVHAADEAIHEQRRNPTSGRTVQDAIDLDRTEEDENALVPVKPSILQRPAQMGFDFHHQTGDSKPKVRTGADPLNMPPMESQIQQFNTKASQSMRQYLDLKEKVGLLASELRSLQHSLQKHETTRQELQQQRANIGASISQNVALDNINEDEQNASRVIAQLQRKIEEVEQSHAQAKQGMEKANAQSKIYFQKTKDFRQRYRDPLSDATRLRPNFGSSMAGNNRIVRSLERFRVGLPIQQAPYRSLATSGASHPISSLKKSLVASRLSHAVTINTHLAYPVYCLRFDKTGRYFITGADDFLVRVFCLGARQGTDGHGKGRLPQGHAETIRGAVLVCTLRGHAGVINDLDVSSDNCFVATASDDGDCRVWGLKDGAPVAILRGHEGGANMVSWSQLTPYRLVTAGHDGFARTWDVREAALKRYNVAVGKRPEYTLKLTQEEKESKSRLRRGAQEEQPSENGGSASLPPLPPSQNNNQEAPQLPIPDQAMPEQPMPDQPMPDQAVPPLPDQALPEQAPVPPLPLPPAAAAAAEAENEQVNNQNVDANGNNIEPGRFVANDILDEGVKLVNKFQHGASIEERMAAPGTRARRAAVKVLCVTRCPLGGHFATGADDGICRVWEDTDDVDVETVDKRFAKTEFEWMGGDELSKERNRRKSSRTSPSNRLLLQLKGHLNPITDLQYSHAGDRIMTGSQKDGVVRIWSWDVDPSIPDTYHQNNDRGLRHIIIKLMNPSTSSSSDSRKSRRRAPSANSATAPKTACDVAAWSHDDTKIITSQSQTLRETSSNIQPGSHFIFLWDSLTGHCLLGISGAHTMACPVIIPHPTDASIFCSAGADGWVKVWDWETGKCLFSHKNTLEHGQVDPNDRGKISGFLDGTFTPDGTGIVLTDDSGRVSIFDSIVPRSQQLAPPESSVLPKAPFWMMEQYFSNDYYDLFYDTNGYCVERGSQLPPHLAPHGVRCTGSGAPFPDNITDAFRTLVGPLPSSIRDCRWLRESIRCRSLPSHGSSKKSPGSAGHRRGNIMQEFNPLTTILISSTGEIIKTKNDQGEVVSMPPPSSPAARRAPSVAVSPAGFSPQGNFSESRRTSSSGRLLSSNYRWRDYEDMLQEEGMFNEDEDDDDFQLPARRTSSRLNDLDSDDSDEDLENFQRRNNDRGSTPNNRQPSRRNAAGGSPEVRRSSNRRSSSNRNRRQYDEPDSDEDVELWSTNNDPSGPHVADYNTHLFRLPTGSDISRQWLHRLESDSGLSGRKTYAPQVGEEVVYIPRAHFETIEAFPTLAAPWMHWPSEAVWPVVRCRIRDIRYRFPFQDHFGNGKRKKSNGNTCDSVVAILRLEVSGIPVLSQERPFNWPGPTFVDPARNHVFEVSLFESGQEEFLIPYDRYVYRLQCLEEAITANGMRTEGIEISTYYDENDEGEDADLVCFRGKLLDFAQNDHVQNDENLANCGYSALRIGWDDVSQAADANDLSPWEVVVESKTKTYKLSRPCLNEDEKRRIREALKKLKRKPLVREFFLGPVDPRYSDYSVRVEVPMHLTFILRRLDNNYYTSRWSVVADVRLIKDNAIKYNGEIGELPNAAREMYNEFEEAILSEEERSAVHNLETTLVQPETRGSAERSSLENLPPPEASGSSTARRSLRIQIDASQARTQQQAQARSSGRATRSNSAAVPNQQQAAHSASFANASARGRQSRRQSNESGASEVSGRQRHLPPRRASTRVNNDMAGEHSLAVASAPRDSNGSTRRSSRRAGDEGVDRNEENAEVPASPSRRTRSHGPTEESNRDDGGGDDDDTKPPARATRRASAHSKRDSESESETEHKNDNQDTPRQARSRRASGKDAEDEELFDESDAHPPTRRTQKRKSRQESESEQSEESEADSQEESEEAESEQDSDDYGSKRRRAARPSAKRNTRTRKNSAGAASGRRSSTQNVSYEEKSSSEFEEPMSEDDDDLEESTRVRRASRGSPPKKRSPRKAKRSARASRKRRTYSDSEEDSEEDEEEEEIVSPRQNKRRRTARSPTKAKPEPWPDIDQKLIPKAAKSILTYLRAMDSDKIFAIPVAEAYPAIARDYAKRISEPMDYRTIEQERLPTYSSTRELQNDLMLVFNNCIQYNGSNTVLGKFATDMLDMIDDVFENIVSDL